VAGGFYAGGMPSYRIPEYWLKAAIDIRSLAGQIHDPTVKQLLSQAADQCETVARALAALVRIDREPD